jgi:hypothetical protein
VQANYIVAPLHQRENFSCGERILIAGLLKSWNSTNNLGEQRIIVILSIVRQCHKKDSLKFLVVHHIHYSWMMMGMRIQQDALTMANWASSIINLLQKYVSSHLSIYQYSQEIILD